MNQPHLNYTRAPADAVSSGPAASPPVPSLEQALDALKKYDIGSPRGDLAAIDAALRTCSGNPGERASLTRQFLALLSFELPPPARNFVTVRLGWIGDDSAVPALARLLDDRELSYSARSALEMIGSEKALVALRDSLTRLTPEQQVGVIDSLAACGDSKSVAPLTSLLSTSSPVVASAILAALGRIGTNDSAAALEGFKARVSPPLRAPLADALLVCAEQFLRRGEKSRATRIYQGLAGSDFPKHVQLAARRGLLAAMK